MIFKANPTYHKNKKIIFPIVNKYGKNIKTVCRDIARDTSFYKYKIELDDSTIKGIKDGRQIPIDTLGAWAFGTPGYRGNFQFLPDKKNITIRIPDNVPLIVDQLIDYLGDKLNDIGT